MWTRSIVLALRVLNVVYVLAFLGLLAAVPEYVSWLSWAVTAAAAVALIVRFGPLSVGGARSVGPLDAELIVAAATIILTGSVFSGAANVPVVGAWLRWATAAAPPPQTYPKRGE